MKSSGSPCPLDQISILRFKRCPYLRFHLTEIIRAVWLSSEIPSFWKKACIILVHKKGANSDPANFRPITLESVPLKVFTPRLRNSIFHFLVQNIYIQCNIQKGFPLQGRLRWGAGGAAAPSALIHGAGGGRIALHTEFLQSLLSSEGAFSGISDSLVQENFSGGKPPDPHINIESLGD